MLWPSLTSRLMNAAGRGLDLFAGSHGQAPLDRPRHVAFQRTVGGSASGPPNYMTAWLPCLVARLFPFGGR